MAVAVEKDTMEFRCSCGHLMELTSDVNDIWEGKCPLCKSAWMLVLL